MINLNSILNFSSVWFGVKYTPGGHSTFFGLLNTLVHVFMYFYYMVSAMGPRWQTYIWWKKHMTNLQMVQLVTERDTGQNGLDSTGND